MKKAQVANKFLSYAIAILVGLVIFYGVYLAGKALFSFQLGGQTCGLKDEFDSAIDLINDQKYEEAIPIFRKVTLDCKETPYEYFSYLEMGSAYFFLYRVYRQQLSATQEKCRLLHRRFG